jgi:aminomethyltransferase
VEHAEVGTPLKVEIRNKQIDAVVVKTPFYKRG